MAWDRASPSRVGMDLMEINAPGSREPYDRRSLSVKMLAPRSTGILGPGSPFPARDIAFFDPGRPAVRGDESYSVPR